MFKITKKQQLKELVLRVTPVVNVSVVVIKDWKYLVGKRSKGAPDQMVGGWLFPGSRMKFDETPQMAAMRVLKNEAPGIKAQFKKLITVISDKGADKRAYGVTIYYLFNYLSGNPEPNEQLDEFKWVNKTEFSNLSNRHPVEMAIFDEIDQTVKTMNTTEDEILVEVDSSDKEIGTIIKRDAHSSNLRYHRAAWIFLFNSNGEVVLQKRGLNKAHNPGKWDMPGGHQAFGNSIEETAHQELKEEMGIDTSLELDNKALYQDEWQSEFHYVFCGIHNGPYVFDVNEVAEIKTFNCKDLINGKYDNNYSILSHVYKELKNLEDFWQKIVKN